MSKRYRIGLDTDGVKGNLIDLILEDLNSNYKANLSHDTVPEWNIVQSLVPKEDLPAWWERFGQEGFVHDRLQPYPGAVEGVARLQTIADVYVVTSPVWSSKTWVYERNQWLYRHFGIPSNRVMHCNAKYLFYGDMLVDDRTENVVRWQEEHPSGTGVLWAHPFNKDDSSKVKMRTANWDDLYARVVAEIAERK